MPRRTYVRRSFFYRQTKIVIYKMPLHTQSQVPKLRNQKSLMYSIFIVLSTYQVLFFISSRVFGFRPWTLNDIAYIQHHSGIVTQLFAYLISQYRCYFFIMRCVFIALSCITYYLIFYAYKFILLPWQYTQLWYINATLLGHIVFNFMNHIRFTSYSAWKDKTLST